MWGCWVTMRPPNSVLPKRLGQRPLAGLRGGPCAHPQREAAYSEHRPPTCTAPPVSSAGGIGRTCLHLPPPPSPPLPHPACRSGPSRVGPLCSGTRGFVCPHGFRFLLTVLGKQDVRVLGTPVRRTRRRPSVRLSRLVRLLRTQGSPSSSSSGTWVAPRGSRCVPLLPSWVCGSQHPRGLRQLAQSRLLTCPSCSEEDPLCFSIAVGRPRRVCWGGLSRRPAVLRAQEVPVGWRPRPRPDRPPRHSRLLSECAEISLWAR